jgi:hypothetical protein
MNQAQFFKDFEALPPNAQQELIDFAAFLRQRYSSYITKKQEATSNRFFDVYSQLDIGDENNSSKVGVNEVRFQQLSDSLNEAFSGLSEKAVATLVDEAVCAGRVKVA